MNEVPSIWERRAKLAIIMRKVMAEHWRDCDATTLESLSKATAAAMRLGEQANHFDWESTADD